MKNRALFLLALMIGIAFADVSNSQVRVNAKEIKTLGDSLFNTLSPSGIFIGMKCSNVDTLGKSNLWKLDYLFFDTTNPKNSKAFYLKGEDGKISLDSIGLSVVGLFVVKEPWIDSDSAIRIAEGIGGASIRQQYPSCFVNAWLYGWGAPPFYKEWKIEYVCPDSVRTFRINAETGNQIVTKIEPNQVVLQQVTLFPNYPNPFNPSTIVKYSIPKQGNVKIIIYDALGREVALLVNEEKAAGNYTAEFNAANLSSGIYFYQIRSGDYIQTKKMLLLR